MMNTKHLKTMITVLTEKIQQQENELKIKEFSINSLQRKLKFYEDRQGE